MYDDEEKQPVQWEQEKGSPIQIPSSRLPQAF